MTAPTRTTVTLDRDVQLLLKKAMRKRDVSFKTALNDAVRVGLSPAPKATAEPWEPPVFDMGPMLVPEQNLNRLAADMEDEAIIDKMRRSP